MQINDNLMKSNFNFVCVFVCFSFLSLLEQAVACLFHSLDTAENLRKQRVPANLAGPRARRTSPESENEMQHVSRT